MKKIDSTVIKETYYIGVITFLLSVIMQSVFLVVSKWDYTVALGNLLGFVASVGNFFLMGLTVQSALGKEEKDAKSLMKLSQTGRLFLMFTVALIGYLIPIFNTVSVIVPFLFPRIAVALRPIIIKD